MSTSCKLLFSLWVCTAAPHPSMEAFWHFCPISSLLVCIASELGGGDPCSSTSPLSSGLYLMGLYQAGPCRGQRLLSLIPGQWAHCGPSSLPWGTPTPPSHSHCSHCCLGAGQFPPALPCWWAQGPVLHLLLAPQSLLKEVLTHSRSLPNCLCQTWDVYQPSQHGLMKGMSCLTSLISFYDRVTITRDRARQNRSSCARRGLDGI